MALLTGLVKLFNSSRRGAKAGAVLSCSRVVSDGLVTIRLLTDTVAGRPIVEVVGQRNTRLGK